MPLSGRALAENAGIKPPGLLLFLGYLVMIAAGIAGLFDDPTVSITKIAGYSVVSVMWNLAFVAAGLTGALARILGAPRIEIVAVDTLAVILLVWTYVIIAAGTSGSYQAAFVFVAVAMLLLGWAWGTRRYLDRRDEIAGVDQDKEE